MSARYLILWACIAGGSAVALGAFGAHGLRPKLSPEALATFETGVRYQILHALAIFAAVWLSTHTRSTLPLVAAQLWCLGMVLFSGSLYLLATRSLLGIESWRWLGPLTPLGGLCFISGWVLLAIAAFRARAAF
ncbi:MAG: DUF423 domain-containing protein [Kiritimatiellae bacterium]|nr:DUF423 domain-containing protein [Kiritimatiellia bacterium]MCO5067903.1 DUF423 domain-containing protein [Kiritimatiellia bacterium]